MKKSVHHVKTHNKGVPRIIGARGHQLLELVSLLEEVGVKEPYARLVPLADAIQNEPEYVSAGALRKRVERYKKTVPAKPARRK